MKKYNWGIIGAGNIATKMGKAILEVNGEIYSIGSRTAEKAKELAKELKISKAYENFEEIFIDKNVDIIYIATPHNTHYEYIRKALENGKHVLCEKSITINDNELKEVQELAKRNNLILEEAMTIYHMPLYKKLDEIIKSGRIGKVKMVQVNFGSHKEYDVKNRFFSKELAGGALLDIGIYAMSFARFFLEETPNKLLTTADFFETGVDEQSGIILSNTKGQMVVSALTMRAKQPKRGVVSGDKGYIEISNYPRAEKALIVDTETGRSEEIVVGETAKALEYEVADFQKLVEENKRGKEFEYSLDVMKILTDIRKEWGLIYSFEKN